MDAPAAVADPLVAHGSTPILAVTTFAGFSGERRFLEPMASAGTPA